MALQPFGPWPLFFSVSDSLDGGSARRKAATYAGQQIQNKRTQPSMPRVGFEPTTPMFERAKTVHALDQLFSTFVRMRPGNSFFYKTRVRRLRNTALDRTAIVIGSIMYYPLHIWIITDHRGH
jgi:hypothetical protein